MASSSSVALLGSICSRCELLLHSLLGLSAGKRSRQVAPKMAGLCIRIPLRWHWLGLGSVVRVNNFLAHAAAGCDPVFVEFAQVRIVDRSSRVICCLAEERPLRPLVFRAAAM